MKTLTQEQEAEVIRQFNKESRKRTEAAGGVWTETTALDAKLSRGSLSQMASVALAIAGQVGGHPMGGSIVPVKIHDASTPAEPEIPDPTPLLPRAWLIRSVDGTAKGFICERSLRVTLRETLAKHSIDLDFQYTFFKLIGMAQVSILYIEIRTALVDLDDASFGELLAEAERAAEEKLQARPEALKKFKARRAQVSRVLEEYDVTSAEKLINTSNENTDIETAFHYCSLPKAFASSAGYGPEIFSKPLHADSKISPPKILRPGPNTIVLFKTADFGGRRIILWRSPDRSLWFCHRVRNPVGFFSTWKETNHTRIVTWLSELDTYLRGEFGYSLEMVGIDPTQIYAWLKEQ